MEQVQKAEFKLVTVGILTRQQLDDLLGQFPKNALIHEEAFARTVYGPDGRRVLSADRLPSEHWNVRAAQGLVERTYSRHLNY